MCGPDIPRPSLGGALAVLTPTSLSTSNSNSSSTASSPPSTPGSSRASSPAGGPAWSGGSLVFHGPQRVGGVATHATFTPSPSQSADVGADMADYVVGIQYVSLYLFLPSFALLGPQTNNPAPARRETSSGPLSRARSCTGSGSGARRPPISIPTLSPSLRSGSRSRRPWSSASAATASSGGA